MARAVRWMHFCFWAGSALLCAFVACCYGWRFDFCAAVTVYPVWCWAGAGLLLAALAWSSCRRAFNWALVFAWTVFLATCADSPTSLLRSWLPDSNPTVRLQVVSFNCAGQIEAAEEVVALQPDIILFQESPARADLIALVDRSFGPGNHLGWGVDASIVSRGELELVDVPPQFRENFVHARVQFESETIDVISLRLLPSAFRMDLWSPRCWRAFRENRNRRRNQLATVAAYLQTIPDEARLIVGGDFNAPPGDAVFRLLLPRLADAFAEAGRGWGATFINELPLIRIDQLWVNRHVDPLRVTAQRTKFSDHRIVIGDFAVADSPN